MPNGGVNPLSQFLIARCGTMFGPPAVLQTNYIIAIGGELQAAVSSYARLALLFKD